MNYCKARYSVLLTRPANQNNNLQKLIHDLGGEALVLPTINIELIPSLDSNFEHYLKATHLIIIISQNTVCALTESWVMLLKKHADTPIITMGSATTQAAQARGLSVAYTPLPGATSEQLLEAELLQKENINQKQILILTGDGGRDWLASTLQARGAFVHSIALYKRTCPFYTADQLEAIFKPWFNTEKKMKYIFITSQNGLDNLLKIILNVPLFFNKIPVIVPSLRIQALVKSRGFAQVNLAASARDEDMLEKMMF